MHDWLIVLILSIIRALWAALVEALPTWLLLRLFTPDAKYWVIMIALFIHNFILSYIKTHRLFYKD
jgi:hypothetical protein